MRRPRGRLANIHVVQTLSVGWSIQQRTVEKLEEGRQVTDFPRESHIAAYCDFQVLGSISNSQRFTDLHPKGNEWLIWGNIFFFSYFPIDKPVLINAVKKNCENFPQNILECVIQGMERRLKLHSAVKWAYFLQKFLYRIVCCEQCEFFLSICFCVNMYLLQKQPNSTLCSSFRNKACVISYITFYAKPFISFVMLNCMQFFLIQTSAHHLSALLSSIVLLILNLASTFFSLQVRLLNSWISWQLIHLGAWYKRSSPGLACDTADQTALSRFVSGHLRSCSFSHSNKVFPVCAKCGVASASPEHILSCLRLSRETFETDPLLALDFLRVSGLMDDV
ncbi:hypothetical protein AVEN_252173-1 [Araneus ventricosus]|uniref:Uncharacterized protein n=1 Tax=Araneus ventricosus TaxID=182803 RepID=A0A4Y2MYC2_ARAVE|nr:hypothetical protein AVEN_252173-1 [Araneus ventricosus]